MGKSRDIADSAATINFIDNVTSDVQGQINTIDTDPTLGTLTKTFTLNESATITLSSAPTGQPVVSVSKEVPQTGTTNDYWDVNSNDENYTVTDSALATTLDFEAYGISSASSAGFFDVSAKETVPTGVTFNSDGTKMYVVGQVGDDVNEYNLSTAFDVTTAVWQTDVLSVAGQMTNPVGLVFNNDGTKLFVFDSTSIYRYGLTTAYDTATGSYDNNTANIFSTTPGITGVRFNTDGTKMFASSSGSNVIDEYTLSTAYDLTTASKVDGLDVLTAGQNPTGFDFNPDGTRLFVAGGANDIVFEWRLSTAFDVSTAQYTSNIFDFSSDTATSYDLTFNADGTKAYIIGLSEDTVFEYDLPTYSKALLGSGSFTSADVGKTIEANGGKFVLNSADGYFYQTVAPTSYAQVASGNWEMYSVVYNAADGDLGLSRYNDIYNFANAKYDSVSFSVAGQDSQPRQVAFNTDGTKMFVLGAAGIDVNEYTLSTGFDISTASFVDAFSVSSQDTTPTGLAFNIDGTKMFIVGNSGDDVNEYALSTGFDVSTAIFTQLFSVAGQDTNPQGIAFNKDGTKMFIVGVAGQDVNEYTLSTGFNVSTATFVASFSVSAQETSPTGIAFNNNGTKMFIVGNNGDDVNEYTLSTGFDVSTASFVNSFSVAGQETQPFGITFNATGTKMFITGYGGDAVYQYSVGSGVYAPTGYHAAHTTTSTDTTYWTDINSMAADEVAGDGNVYYAVSTDDRTTWAVIDDTDGVRDIVRNNAGTWEYNSNGTYGLETWTAGTTNTELATLEEAMGTAQNQMDKTQLEAVTDPNHYTLGNSLDLAIILSQTTAGAAPSSDGVSINYDANTLQKGAINGTDYEWDYPASDKVRITALAGANLKVRVV